MDKSKKQNQFACSICGDQVEGFGNNAWPINDGRCCGDCNSIVIAKRIRLMMGKSR